MINTALFATRATIWLALAGYAFAVIAFLFSKQRTRWLAWARGVWTAGCIVFLAHVFFAFSFYYDWSHATAYHDTARQTSEIIGWNWGGGLFVSYVFTLAWVMDVLCWWWQGLQSYGRRSRALMIAWHAFFFFIVFNGTVVFGTGPVRWFGVLLCLSLFVVSWRTMRWQAFNN